MQTFLHRFQFFREKKLKTYNQTNTNSLSKIQNVFQWNSELLFKPSFVFEMYDGNLI